ncbi:MAG: 4-(cytidine 5'-diphospho)-2-C-methyl-D-erythritol kinase, partial [Gammaproteobacteria bacterium]
MKNDISEELNSQIWLAPAKLNLFLHIIGQREDGYHQLQTVIQFIDICDQLQFSIREDGEIRRENTVSAIAHDDDGA